MVSRELRQQVLPPWPAGEIPAERLAVAPRGPRPGRAEPRSRPGRSMDSGREAGPVQRPREVW